VLFVHFRRQGYCPPPDDVQFARDLAAQCAHAIDRARAYDEREELRRRAEQIAKIAEARVVELSAVVEQRDDLLRAISHDVRTPLTALLLQAQTLERSLDPNDRRGRSVRTIVTNAKRIAAMINDLVDMVRFESGKWQVERRPIDVGAFVLEIKDRLAEMLATERVRISVEPDLPLLFADPDRLERVVVNLLSNALKYSEPGSEVVLCACARHGSIEISVTDHGKGIPHDEIPHLFERFYRARNVGRKEGLGLGLYIAAMLVKAHGGSIEVDSEVGKGSVFRIALPIGADLPAVTKPESERPKVLGSSAPQERAAG
jgi:signal transduction histidine kinase